MTNSELLKELEKKTNMTFEEMAFEALGSGLSPSICTNCGYITNMEPDQDRGWCESCEKNTVVSCLILAGII